MPANDLNSIDQHVMLAILRLHPIAYGVNIGDQISKRADRSYSIGAIYAALERLEERGYLTAQLGEATAERGGRRKLYYTLTAPGQATLEHSLRGLDNLRRGIRLVGVGA